MECKSFLKLFQAIFSLCFSMYSSKIKALRPQGVYTLCGVSYLRRRAPQLVHFSGSQPLYMGDSELFVIAHNMPCGSCFCSQRRLRRSKPSFSYARNTCISALKPSQKSSGVCKYASSLLCLRLRLASRQDKSLCPVS